MAKNIAQKFKDFKQKHGLTTSMVKKMAIEYADSNESCSMEYWADRYGVSRDVFNRARDFAISCCLVDTGTTQRIKAKSTSNYKKNNPKNKATMSNNHFEDLVRMQKDFLDTYSVNDIRDIACKYVEGISIDKIAIVYDTGESGIKRLLRRGVECLIIDQKTIGELQKLLGDRIATMLERRAKNKSLIIQNINDEIGVLSFKIRNYTVYFSGVDSKPTLEELNKALVTLEKRRDELKNM